MPEFVRVRDEDGHEFTINELAVNDAWTVLDEPACDLTGRPRRAIPNTTAKKKAAPARTPETTETKEL